MAARHRAREGAPEAQEPSGGTQPPPTDAEALAALQEGFPEAEVIEHRKV